MGKFNKPKATDAQCKVFVLISLVEDPDLATTNSQLLKYSRDGQKNMVSLVTLEMKQKQI